MLCWRNYYKLRW